MLLVGDWAQLSPVQAGGAFKLLADDRSPDAPTLHEVHRFTHDWERDASLQLRLGNADVADTYLVHGRVESGDREDLLDLLFDAWRTDTEGGRASLMLSADAQTVSDLNGRAQAHRIRSGEVTPDGVRLENGTIVGVGDRIVTRQNLRALATGRGWVQNGDDWIVTDTNPDGSLTVTRLGGGVGLVLPAEYVLEHVELGYASTAYRAQGRTVDTAHAYVTASTQREPLYVMATRGRDSNRLYVDTAYDRDQRTDHQAVTSSDPTEVLATVIATTGADLAAHETRRQEQTRALQRAVGEPRPSHLVASEKTFGPRLDLWTL
ncbi:hypothetical protein GCM10009867_21860 [Pedococcus aerophilus]|uniref:Uncharacterized protein n=1 Tax=Pedococcus aerophilus TaxID=436356 RepID=A0ABN3UP88_9MICO